MSAITVTVTLEIDNTYQDGHQETTHVATSVAAPEFEGSEIDPDWWWEHIMQHTGTGYGITKPNGKPRKRTLDALYAVKITESSDPRLVGLEYEF